MNRCGPTALATCSRMRRQVSERARQELSKGRESHLIRDTAISGTLSISVGNDLSGSRMPRPAANFESARRNCASRLLYRAMLLPLAEALFVLLRFTADARRGMRETFRVARKVPDYDGVYKAVAIRGGVGPTARLS